DVVASGVWVDPARIGGPPSPEPPEPHVPVVLPPFKIRDVRVTDASLRLSGPPERNELPSARTRGTVEITRLTNRLGIKVNARDVVLNWNDRILAIDVARARAQDTAQGLELTYAFARGEGVHATARAKSGATLTHIVHADVDVQRLAFVD